MASSTPDATAAGYIVEELASAVADVSEQLGALNTKASKSLHKIRKFINRKFRRIFL